MLLKLPQNLRTELSKPLGELIETSPEKSYPKILNIINTFKPQKIITVGDVITFYLLMYGIIPNVSIVDHRSLRRNMVFPYNYDYFFNMEVPIINPPGTINVEAWNIIKSFIRKNIRVLFKVYGEEDLLTLPLILEAEEGTIIFYGQPTVGIVSIEVTRGMKRKAKLIIEKFERIC